MDEDEYRIININNTIVKCFRDGRIHTISKRWLDNEHWIERTSLPNNRGYISIQLGEKMYQAHRLIMLAFVGYSDKDIDHINRIKHDNRLENLRYCTRRENGLNTISADNAKGVYWHKGAKKWMAQLKIHNKHKYLGLFDNEEDARQCYLQAKANPDNI